MITDLKAPPRTEIPGGGDATARPVMNIACVLPCYNEALVLADTLESVFAAGLEPLDVIVVDDCSTDATSEIARRFGVQLIRNERNLGKSKSIARAIEHVRSRGRHAFVAVLDADTLVDPGYFDTVVRTFVSDADIVLVAGQPRSRRHNWLTAYRAIEYAMSHAIYKQAQHKMNVITVAPGCASTYRLSVLEHLEWNPAILTEDADTTVQIYRKGLGKVVYERGAVVHTQDPSTIRALKGQLRRWYTGLWQVVVCHRIPFGWQRLDAEFALVLGEALLFSLLLAVLPVLLVVAPEQLIYYLLIDQMIFLAIACGFAIRHRRPDVVAYAPLFIVPRMLNCVMFLSTFVAVVIFRRHTTHWFSPPRYVPRASLRSIRGGSNA